MIRILLGMMGLLLALAGCGGTKSGNQLRAEANAFSKPISASAGTVESWKLVRVDVTVDPSLKVSKDPSVQFPREEIVWYGQAYGNRRAQVDKIVTDAVSRGAVGLHGNRPVVLDIDLKLFHGVTPKAVSNTYYAWHDIQFIIKVRDASSGKVLETSVPINADLEAYRREAAKQAALKGETQTVRVSRRISSVVYSWLQSNGATIGRPGTTRAAPQRRAAPAPKPQGLVVPSAKVAPPIVQPLALPIPTDEVEMPEQPTMPDAPDIPDGPELALTGVEEEAPLPF